MDLIIPCESAWKPVPENGVKFCAHFLFEVTFDIREMWANLLEVYVPLDSD